MALITSCNDHMFLPIYLLHFTLHFLISAQLIFSILCSESKETHQNLLLLDLNSKGPACKKRDQVDNSHEEKNNQYELPIFSFSSIVASTDNFSITNKLGEGGFGPVYKVNP